MNRPPAGLGLDAFIPVFLLPKILSGFEGIGKVLAAGVGVEVGVEVFALPNRDPPFRLLLNITPYAAERFNSL